jgi:hydrogenase nickel incorporation protein HypA/HybF
MHELYIAESILRSVSASLPCNVGPELVTQVRVQVGQLDAVIPETLKFSFNAIKQSSGMPRAELHIERIAVRCRCHDCAHEFGIDLPVFICPECHRGHVEVLQGRGITLSQIIADDPEGETHGHTGHS